MEQNREEAASTILHEALNGFSVVFVGALLGSDIDQLFQNKEVQGIRFKKLSDIRSLNAFSENNHGNLRRCKEIGMIW